ncbi:MAG: transglutaminase domain-containing protein [Thermoplasmatota archaeon]
MRVALLLVLTSLSGCLGFWDEWTRPDIPVQRTPLDVDGWNTDPRFVVLVDDVVPQMVVITARSGGEELVWDGVSDSQNAIEAMLPDGTWDIAYTVANHPWESFKGVRFDSTPPTIEGLARSGDAVGGSYTVGADAVVAPGDDVVILQGGNVVAQGLPATVSVDDGITSLLVVVTDPAGNERTYTVQARSGDGAFLPEGQWDFGVVATYTNSARVWDLKDMDAYLQPSQAAAQAPGWLGAGFGVTPDHPAVQEVVDDVVQPGDSTMDIAWNLYRWMFDSLEYDEARLSADDLLEPEDTIAQGGGVCRDLAGAYVSLLRAAGVPARLVSGYLAGEVNGFHAWAEVYVGDHPGNPSPWMPVDVSPMDGMWGDDRDGLPHGLLTAMTSFAIALPEYLPLREVPSPEPEGWSTALSVQYSYPESSGEPDIQFEKQILDETSQDGRLCFDPDTLHRHLSPNCSGPYFDFVLQTERTMDYGIDVVAAGPGTDIDATVAVPFASAVAPDFVSFQIYGQAYEIEEGNAVAQFQG